MAGGGQLKLSVRPADASVYVDGAFRGSGREVSLLALPPGRHRIEVVRPGFSTVERDVEITAGEHGGSHDRAGQGLDLAARAARRERRADSNTDGGAAAPLVLFPGRSGVVGAAAAPAALPSRREQLA